MSEPGGEEPLVAAGASFTGTVSFRGAVRIDGRLRGHVRAGGRLIVGPGAHVRASVEVDELVVSGLVEGRVNARERVAILPGGRIRGSLQTPRLALSDGGVLDGTCRTGVSPPGTPHLREPGPG